MEAVKLIVAFVCLTGVSALPSARLEKRAALNRDTRYDVWANPQRILFRLDTNYNGTEAADIDDAMNQISSDMSSCIRFSPFNVVTDSREDHIFISPVLNSGVLATSCSTFPGRLVRQNGQGQKMIMTAGPGGCMSAKRDIMAVLVSALGLRNEHKRPDRDDFLQTFPSNILPDLQSLNLLRIYNASQIEFRSTAFDLLSITIPSASRFARANTVLYTPRDATRTLGNLARLSVGDCNALRRMYPTCSSITCRNPYANATLASVASTSTNAPASGNAPTSTSAILEAVQSAAGASGSGLVIANTNTVGATTTSTSTARTTVAARAATTTQSGPVESPFDGLEFALRPQA
ncbi:zinc metalloproteinase nas-14-like [Paramacrobiotus metropolitanus]|uniref:zinc metalloproteinase nas-14-like n=1 Tax=Paramacrobiotus metropolitanus TaxID=2943436 RepID=UPI00244650D4|nr:zinc metalloproteinase nas-14-like [Paramacrobiotus metropolitanus]